MAGEDSRYTSWTRDQPCAACGTLIGVQPHHALYGTTYSPEETRPAKAIEGARKGMSQRSHDHFAIPMCLKDHEPGIHKLGGFFEGWTRAQANAWEEEQVRIHRNRYAVIHLLAYETNGSNVTASGVLSLARASGWTGAIGGEDGVDLSSGFSESPRLSGHDQETGSGSEGDSTAVSVGGEAVSEDRGSTAALPGADGRRGSAAGGSGRGTGDAGAAGEGRSSARVSHDEAREWLDRGVFSEALRCALARYINQQQASEHELERELDLHRRALRDHQAQLEDAKADACRMHYLGNLTRSRSAAEQDELSALMRKYPPAAELPTPPPVVAEPATAHQRLAGAKPGE